MRGVSQRFVRALIGIAICLSFVAPALSVHATELKPTSAQTVQWSVARTTYVYKTRTGHRYHRGSCRYLAWSKKRVTLKRAKSMGLTPCKVCGPPRK